MKRNKPLLFFSSLLLTMFVINLAANPMISSGENGLEQTLNNYSLRVDSSLNESIYYVSANNQIVDFSIQCNDWGYEFGQGYIGLLIEIIFDENDSTLNSWLILSGDMTTHFFTSEVEVSGIIQIKFSALNIYTIDFEMEIADTFPIWTYKTTLNILNDGFFGIERSEVPYSSLEKIVLDFTTNFIVSFNYTCEILDEFNQIIAIFSGNVTKRATEVITFTLDDGLFLDNWYQLRFNIEETIHSTVTCKIFYDHHWPENIARIFLETSNQELSSIPIDYIRSSPSFYWRIFEEYLPPPPPPPPFPNIEIFIVIGIVCGLALIFTLIGISGLRVKQKNTRFRMNTTNQPSEKYYQKQNQSAKYAPTEVYGVNFAQKTKDYSIETSDEINVTCSICLQKIDNHDQLIRCPSCDIAFHKNHLYQWIVGNGNCPACKSRLRITEY